MVIIGVFITINTSGVLSSKTEAESGSVDADEEYAMEAHKYLALVNEHMGVFISKLNEGIENPILFNDGEWSLHMTATNQIKAIDDNLDVMTSLKPTRKHRDLHKKLKKFLAIIKLFLKKH